MEFYDKFLNLSQKERINLCKNSINGLMEYFKARGYLEKENFASSFFTSLIGYFIGVDGNVTPNEAAIFNEVFGTNYSAGQLAGYLPKFMTSKNFTALNNFIDKMDKEHKNFCCYIVLAVITADGSISNRERKLFEEILN